MRQTRRRSSATLRRRTSSSPTSTPSSRKLGGATTPYSHRTSIRAAVSARSVGPRHASRSTACPQQLLENSPRCCNAAVHACCLPQPRSTHAIQIPVDDGCSWRRRLWHNLPHPTRWFHAAAQHRSDLGGARGMHLPTRTEGAPCDAPKFAGEHAAVSPRPIPLTRWYELHVNRSSVAVVPRSSPIRPSPRAKP
jgi:hypothetical protein